MEQKNSKQLELCPNCGSTAYVQGQMGGYTGIFPKGNKFRRGSGLNADVCKDCGLVIRLWVEHPERLI